MAGWKAQGPGPRSIVQHPRGGTAKQLQRQIDIPAGAGLLGQLDQHVHPFDPADHPLVGEFPDPLEPHAVSRLELERSDRPPQTSAEIYFPQLEGQLRRTEEPSAPACRHSAELGRAVVPYRPLPPNSALGLSAFYIALLTTFCGFLGAVIVGTSIDAVLGYATTEIGPIWRQRQPVAISRWQTLLAKWVMAIGLTVILTGLMLFTAVVILKMNAPHFGSLWLLSWFATVVAIGTLVLFVAGYFGSARRPSGVRLPGSSLFRRDRPTGRTLGLLQTRRQLRAATADPRRSPGNLVLRRPRRCRADTRLGCERAGVRLLGGARHLRNDVV